MTSSTACRKTSTACSTRSSACSGSIRAVTNNIAHDLRSPLNRLRNRLRRRWRNDDSGGRHGDHRARHRREPTTCWRPSTPLLSIADAEAGTSRGNLPAGRPRRAQPGRRRALRAAGRGAGPGAGEVDRRAGDRVRQPPAAVPGHRQPDRQRQPSTAPRGGRISSVRAERQRAAPRSWSPTAAPAFPPPTASACSSASSAFDSSRTTPGNGLGLSLVAAIARLHNAVPQPRRQRAGAEGDAAAPAGRRPKAPAAVPLLRAQDSAPARCG